MRCLVRALFSSLGLVLALSASLLVPTAASASHGQSDRSGGARWSGAGDEEEGGSRRVRLAKAFYGDTDSWDDDDEARPRRRYRTEDGERSPRYTQRRHQRHAKTSRRGRHLARQHGRRKISKLKKLIGHLGQIAPIIIGADNTIIDGHASWLAMRELGADESAVVTAKTATPPPVSNGCPSSGSGTIDVSTIAPPARLVVDGQTVSPTVITRSTSDVTLRFHVSACSGRSISGALVYATAVPFSQFSIPAEAQTGADGWVTLTMHQDRYFPASSRQQLLAGK